MNISPNVKIIDATLREGNQVPGVRFTVQQSRVIATLLARAGVDAIECGHAAVSAHERARIRAVVDLDLGLPVLSHARACIEDVQRVGDTGAHWVGVFAAGNPISRATRLSGRSQQDVIVMVERAIEYAKRLGLRVRYTLEDASRTNIDEVFAIFRRAIDAGADRLCFADTVGIAAPDEVLDTVRAIRSAMPAAPLEIHLHDDRGLALASALKAVEADVQWLSTSVNGLGERCGIVDLSALLANLDFLVPGRSWNFAALQELSAYVGAVTREPPDARRPVVGRYAFTHTAKLHSDAVKCDEMAYSWRAPRTLARDTATARAPGGPDVGRLITKAAPICATELPHHRTGPGTRYVMLDDRFIDYAKQYCIVREIPFQATAPAGHVDVHRHNVDSVFLFIGKRDGLTGLRASVTLEGQTVAVESPASVLIPGGVEHSYAVLGGEGYFVNFVHAGTYAESLLHLSAGIEARSVCTHRKEALQMAAGESAFEAQPVERTATPGGSADSQIPTVSAGEFSALVAQFVSKRSGADAAQIGPDYDYLKAGLLDSLGVMELFFYMEETLHKQFHAEELLLERMSTAAKFYEFMLTQ